MTLEAAVPRVATLDNGLAAVGLHLPHLHRVALWVHLRVGSRFETKKTSGLSHFLEHMLYRGTPTYPSAQSLALGIERLGGSLGAETGADSGWMSVSVPPDAVEASLDILAEVFQQPVFSAIETEKGIIREELLEELDEDGRLVEPDSLLRALIFGDHPLGLPIGGTIESLERFDVAMLSSHHRKHYVGAAAAVAVCGPIEPGRALDGIARAFASVPRGVAPAPEPPPPPGGPRFQAIRHASSQTSLRVAFRAPGTHDALEPATDLLLRLLDDGMSTRLYRQVCDEKGLCYDVSAGYEAYPDVGLFDLSADSTHERADAVLGELLDVVQRLRDSGPDASEIDKAKARHRFQMTEMLDSPEHLAEYHCDHLLTGRLHTLAERRDAIGATTRDQLVAAAQRLFTAENLHAIAVGTPSRAQKAALAERIRRFS